MCYLVYWWFMMFYSASLSNTIADSLKQQGIPVASVECPSGQRSDVGDTIECTVVTAGSRTVKEATRLVHVSVVNSAGNIVFTLESKD